MNVATIRRLFVCAICGKLGVVDATPDDDVTSVVRVNATVVAHPACLPVEQLLALPPVELGHVRLCDVTAPVMKRILKAVTR
jgi:hypothetical protein